MLHDIMGQNSNIINDALFEILKKFVFNKKAVPLYLY